MKPIRCGLLRHKITIQQPPATSANQYGELAPTGGWSTFAVAWASIEPVGGREFEFAKTFAATVSHKVTLRYVQGLLDTMRVQYGSRLFAINAILNAEERNRMLTLFCTERTD